MSYVTARTLTIAFGVLLCVAAVGFFALSLMHYEFRRTYVRPVYYAVQQGKDPYQAALVCAEEMAEPQMSLAGLFASVVFVLAGAVVVLAIKQKPETKILTDDA